jgi:tight adherence protein C
VFPLVALLGKLIPSSAIRREALKSQLMYVHSNLTIEEFAGLQILSVLACSFACLVILVEFVKFSPLVVVLAGACGFIIPNLWIRSRVQRRHQAIVRLLPEVIDLLSLCVGAGMDFLAALNKVALLKMFKREPLVQELLVTLQEIRLGKRRFDAFKAMAKRVNLQELSSFVRTIVQADRMGTPIEEVLLVHSEDFRLQRFTRAERTALRAPIKILIPLIFCIMPCVGIIVGAPIFIQFMKQNPFAQ